MRRPNLIEAMRRLDLVSPETPVVEDATPDSVRGKVLLGPVPPRLGRYARLIAEPNIRIEEHERSGDLSVAEIVERFAGLSWFRVEDLGAPTEPADIITTRHEGLIEFIREMELAKPGAPVEPHAQREHVAGLHAVGVLPYRIGEAARRVTNVPTALPPDLQWTEITAEQQRLYVGEGCFSYRVHRVETPDA